GLAEAAPGGVDYAFDAVGEPATAQLALRLARSSGTAVLVGLPPAGARLDLDPAELTRREKRLTGSMYGSQDPAVALPVLLAHARSGALDLAGLVGPELPLERVNEAIELALAGVPGRVIVRP
ncbi:MAG TPA: zinc-binding dehydrogenase, partial [Gaiellaceae bacterium]|nr:zinc-binding dehydrogenase [Gaiellaceae bacterium]